MLYSTKIKSLMIDRITKEWDNIPLFHHAKMELQVYIRVYIEYSVQNGNVCVCVLDSCMYIQDIICVNRLSFPFTPTKKTNLTIIAISQRFEVMGVGVFLCCPLVKTSHVHLCRGVPYVNKILTYHRA